MQLGQRVKLFFGFIGLAFIALYDPKGTQKFIDKTINRRRDEVVGKAL